MKVRGRRGGSEGEINKLRGKEKKLKRYGGGISEGEISNNNWRERKRA
jgi:hypothetical protein